MFALNYSTAESPAITSISVIRQELGRSGYLGLFSQASRPLDIRGWLGYRNVCLDGNQSDPGKWNCQGVCCVREGCWDI